MNAIPLPPQANDAFRKAISPGRERFRSVGPVPDWKAVLTTIRLFKAVALAVERRLQRFDKTFQATRQLEHHGELHWEIVQGELVLASVHLEVHGLDPGTGLTKPALAVTVLRRDRRHDLRHHFAGHIRADQKTADTERLLETITKILASAARRSLRETRTKK